ncbi:tyrosine-type recombinase/integrase [Haloferax volcanii]|uniref:tyrosine-type recombinase/integrase n=1 Tax=Haloferax volcanii TaxID=2246 RepID=UPI003D3033A1
MSAGADLPDDIDDDISRQKMFSLMESMMGDVMADAMADKMKDIIMEAVDDSPDLISFTPEEAIDEFIESKKGDTTKNTREAYRKSLHHFVDFCERNEIDEMRNLDGTDLTSYRTYRREESWEDTLSPKTMKDEQWLMNAFISHLETVDAVEQDLSDAVKIPDVDEEDEVRDEYLPHDRQTSIIEHLGQYKYATAEHVTWLLLSTRGVRRCTVRAPDLKDFDAEKQKLELYNRPEEGTRLKNGKKSERNLSLPDRVVTVLQDYIKNHRHDVTDDYGRQPLITTQYGRVSKTTISKYVYKWTRPCEIRGSCPHDRDQNTCVAMESAGNAPKCPDSKSTHTIRKGYFTYHCNNGVPKKILSDQADVSEKILEKHYNMADKEDKRELNRKVFDEFYGNDEEGFYA